MEDNSQTPKAEVKIDDGSARSKLIVTARKLFAQKGLEGTSTRDIAKEAGLNISLISYYFSGKEGLYKAVIEEFASQAAAKMKFLFETLDLENMNRESFKTAMHTVISGMILMKVGEPDINMIFHRELISGMPFAKDIFNQYFVHMVEKIVSLYMIGQKKGFVRKDINPYVVFLSIAHSSDAFVRLGNCNTKMKEKVPSLPEEMDEYIEQVYRIFVEGVIV